MKSLRSVGLAVVFAFVAAAATPLSAQSPKWRHLQGGGLAGAHFIDDQTGWVSGFRGTHSCQGLVSVRQAWHPRPRPAQRPGAAGGVLLQRVPAAAGRQPCALSWQFENRAQEPPPAQPRKEYPR
jgi:hypothetical protein